jgi:CheY-like chemotaxis protein
VDPAYASVETVDGRERDPGGPNSEGGDRVAVLLVDDDTRVLDALADLVETDPTLTVVSTACRIEEAVSAARLWMPEVAVVDVNMPGGGGWAAARGLREVCPEIRLVVYSAFHAALVSRTMAACGISAYITKGSDDRLLLAAIHGEDLMPAPPEVAPLRSRGLAAIA